MICFFVFVLKVMIYIYFILIVYEELGYILIWLCMFIVGIYVFYNYLDNDIKFIYYKCYF